jgi:hypothetical protein
MPAKPRAQQEDYVDDEGVRHTGEKNKFLSPEMAQYVAVIKDGADLTRQLKAVRAGTKKILYISPQLMRDHVQELQDAGFGGEKSFYFADEAHEFAVGQKEGGGSGMAKAAKEMAKSEYACAGSGTLIDNDASELASLLQTFTPGAVDNVNQFAGEWKRLAGGKQDLFSSESMRGMRDRLSGSMVSYHKPVTKKNESGEDEALTLEKQVIHTDLNARQRAAITKVNAQYQKDKISDDPAQRKSAALVRRSRIDRVINTGADNPKLEEIRKIQEAEQKRDPKNRVGVYSPEIAPLKSAMEAIKGKTVSVTGANDDQQTRDALAAINDRTNDVTGMGISNAGNYGINAHGLDHLVKMKPIDVPSKEDQLDHRHFRTGQTRNVRATTLVSNHPQERMAMYRNREVKLPELSLLSTLADDSGRSAHLTGHQRAIDEAAKG